MMERECVSVKITLSTDEMCALDVLRNLKCNGIRCSQCPLRLENTNDRCLRTLAREVNEKLTFDPRCREAYSLYNFK